MSEKKYMLRLPEELHKKAKIRAVSEEISLNSLIVKALQAYLKTKAR